MNIIDKIKNAYYGAVKRFKATTPLVFKRVIKISACVSGTSIAIHTAISEAGAVEPDWWVIIYPYLVGIPAGMAFVAMFTQSYDNNGNPVFKDSDIED